MPLTTNQHDQIRALLTNAILEKLASYTPETNYMPFHVRLLGQDRMALYSFIHSINTILGQSVFEQTAEIIAKTKFAFSKSQYKELPATITISAQSKIQEIMDQLIAQTKKANKLVETNEILYVAKSGILKKVKKPTVDLYVKSGDGVEYYFDIKTAKPNKDGFKDFKRKMLDWIAMRGSVDNTVKIKTLVAIPYNPYYPKPYERWTLAGMMDLDPENSELLVAEEFWSFLGDSTTYEELLLIVEQVGITLKPVIDKKFSEYKLKP